MMKYAVCGLLGLLAIVASTSARADDSIAPAIVIPSLERLEKGMMACGIKHAPMPSAWLKSLGLLGAADPKGVVSVSAGDLTDKVYVRDVLEPWWKRIVMVVPTKPGPAKETVLPPNGDFGAHEIKVGERSWFVGLRDSAFQISRTARVVQIHNPDIIACGDLRETMLERSPGVASNLSTSDVIVTDSPGALQSMIGWWSTRNRSIPTWLPVLVKDVESHYLTAKLSETGIRLDLTVTLIKDSSLAQVKSGSRSLGSMLTWMPWEDFIGVVLIDSDDPGLHALIERAAAPIPATDASISATAFRTLLASEATACVFYAPQADPLNVGHLTNTLIHYRTPQGERAEAALEHFRTMVGTWGLLTADETDGSSWSAGAMSLVSTPIDTWNVWPSTASQRTRFDEMLYGPSPGARGFAATRDEKGWITLGQSQGTLAEALRPTGPRNTLAESEAISAARASLPAECCAMALVDGRALLPILSRQFPDVALTLPEKTPLVAIGMVVSDGKITVTAIIPKELVKLADDVYGSLLNK